MKRSRTLPTPFALIETLVIATAIALPLVGLAVAPTSAAGGEKPFSSMKITADEGEECCAPRPPSDLAPTAYVRNGYRAILRIMAAEMWRETRSCECFLTQITWDQVIERSEDFKVSDDLRRPFDVSALRLQADAMLAERDEACAE